MNIVSIDKARVGRRLFFVIIASAVIATVFAGFAPTFYLRGSFTQDRPMSLPPHIHGIVFSAWVTVFLLQTILIARGSRRLHQQFGSVAVGIAAMMVILVVAAMIEQLTPYRRLSAAAAGPGAKRIRHHCIRNFGWRGDLLSKTTGMA